MKIELKVCHRPAWAGRVSSAVGEQTSRLRNLHFISLTPKQRQGTPRHGTARAHLLKLPKLPPPSHPPHPPRPLVLLNTPTFCLKPRQAGTWNPSALNREISRDILKQCNFPFCFLLSHIFTFNPLLFDIPFFIRAEEIEL